MLSLPRVVMDVAMFSEQVNIENVKVALSCHLWPLEQKKIVTRTFVNVSEYNDECYFET